MNLVQRTVRKLIKEHQTNDPFILADYLNVGVRYVSEDELDDDTEQDFTAVYVPTIKPLIIINGKYQYSSERYFFMAHELYHAINHSDVIAYYHGGYGVKGKMEREANQFATYLRLIGATIWEGQSSRDVLRVNYIPQEMEGYL